MKCKKCGEELPERARFCFVCGAPVEDVPEPHRLEEPLDPLAAGAVPLVPIAPPPRAYKFEPKAMRTVTARGERRPAGVSPEAAERAERAERGFVLPFGDRAEKAARSAAFVSADEEAEDEKPVVEEAGAVTAEEPQAEVEKDLSSEPGDEKDGESERHDDEVVLADGEQDDAAPEDVAADGADEPEPAAEGAEGEEPEELEKPEDFVAPEAIEDGFEEPEATAPIALESLAAPEDDEADAPASGLDATEDLKAARVAPAPEPEPAAEPPAAPAPAPAEEEPERQGRAARRRGLRGPELVLAGVMLVAAVVVVVLLAGLATSWIGPFSPAPEEAPKVQPPSDGDVEPIDEEDEEAPSAGAPEPKATVADYSWQELSQISALIADAATDEEGLQIAREYHLCNDDGTLDGTQTKEVALSNGTSVPFAVAGFRSDERADGSGVAGITFVARAPLATEAYNASGAIVSWEDCTLRSWMNQSLMAELPAELADLIVPVTKVTNVPNGGGSQCETTDTLWLLSRSEMGGTMSGGQTAEGDQYQIFSDAGVEWQASSFLAISDDYWWQRGPGSDTRWQQTVGPDGSMSTGRTPSYVFGVVAGFCL